MTTRATVASCQERLATYRANPNADALKELCNDISISELFGNNIEFALLWEDLVAIQKEVHSFSEIVAIRKAIKHVFQEKDRVAPKSEEVDPSGLRPVRFVRR